MAGGWKKPIRRLQQALASPGLWHWLRRERLRYGLSWLLAFAAIGTCFCLGWFIFEAPGRNDYRPPGGPLRRPSGEPWGGNAGHTMIDFGGQWLMGRLLVEGRARELYNRNVQRHLLLQAYPQEDEDTSPVPDGEPPRNSDAEMLMFWLMGYDSRSAAETVAVCLTPVGTAEPLNTAIAGAAAENVLSSDRLNEVTAKQIGGPLYPPINAFLNYPLAHLSPLLAYRVHQGVSLVLGVLAGLAVTLLTRGRIWWPIAITAVMAYPGFTASVQLGQNAALTLNILLWGWLLLSRGRPLTGGMVWGLLAYKPVWAAAFFLVPLLTHRWRFCLGMLGAGAALVLATVPVVGIQTWLDWVEVGRLASNLYDVDKNWIFLSRDLLSVPRRWLVDFNIENVHDRAKLWQLPMLYSYALLLGILEISVRSTVLHRRRVSALSGYGPAFMMLGAWLACFHFMYYDVLLTVLPVTLLFIDPRKYLKPIYVSVRGGEDLDPGQTATWLLNRMVPTLVLLVALTGNWLVLIGLCPTFGTPWDTFVLMGLWFWCGWRLVRDREGGEDLIPSSAENQMERQAGAESVAAVLETQPGAVLHSAIR